MQSIASGSTEVSNSYITRPRSQDEFEKIIEDIVEALDKYHRRYTIEVLSTHTDRQNCLENILRNTLLLYDCTQFVYRPIFRESVFAADLAIRSAHWAGYHYPDDYNLLEGLIRLCQGRPRLLDRMFLVEGRFEQFRRIQEESYGDLSAVIALAYDLIEQMVALCDIPGFNAYSHAIFYDVYREVLIFFKANPDVEIPGDWGILSDYNDYRTQVIEGRQSPPSNPDWE